MRVSRRQTTASSANPDRIVQDTCAGGRRRLPFCGSPAWPRTISGQHPIAWRIPGKPGSRKPVAPDQTDLTAPSSFRLIRSPARRHGHQLPLAPTNQSSAVQFPQPAQLRCCGRPVKAWPCARDTVVGFVSNSINFCVNVKTWRRDSIQAVWEIPRTDEPVRVFLYWVARA